MAVYARNGAKIRERESVKKNSGSSFLPPSKLISDRHWSNLAGCQMERVWKRSLQRSFHCDVEWSRIWAENIPEHK